MHRAWLAMLIGVLGCATTGAPKPQGPALDPGLIRSPDLLTQDFQWRQHVVASWPTGQRGFDAVVQKRKGELLMIGLSPMGMPGFIFRLKSNGAIDVENHTGRALPFRPEYIIADVQRVLYPWLPPPAADQNGEREGNVGGTRVVERYEHGTLVERTFQRVNATATASSRGDAADSGSVRIRYQGSVANADVANRVNVDNGWFGYRLAIETLSYSRLAIDPRQ